jgi:hypothetical protein
MANILSTSFSISSIDLEDSLCSHVEVGETPYAVFKEDDSFGPVGRYAVCEDCYKEEKAKEEEELVTCDDCKKKHPRKDVMSWRWYDFYAAQGDEPFEICNECWDLPKHSVRRADDAQVRKSESEDDMYSHSHFCNCDMCYSW